MMSLFHRGVGIALSILLLIVSVSGILLIWKKEYLALSLAVEDAPVINPVVIKQSVNHIVDFHGARKIRLIQIYPYDLAIFKVFLTGKKYAWHQADGKHIETWTSNQRLEDWLLDFHHRLLLGNTIGLNTVGLGSLLAIISILIGFKLWWRRRRILSLGIIPKSRQRGAWIIAHSNLGALWILPILFLLISGIILVYPQQSAAILLGDHANHPPSGHARPIDSTPMTNDLKQQFDYALSVFPNATLRWLVPFNRETPMTTIGLQQADGFNRYGNTILYFENDGTVRIKNALLQSQNKRMFDFVLPLHTAVMPFWYRILLTVFGMGLSAVCYFAIRSWMKILHQR